MSVDVSYDPVSPARYPNPGRKRKSTKSAHPVGKKKKKKKKEKENDPVVTPEDCDPVVREVVEDTRAAVEDMMKELNDLVEQSVQAPPPPQFTLTTVYDNADACVRLEARQSQKGWNYVKCPIQPCLLFCGQDQAPDYMKAVYSQPRPEVLDM